MGKRLFSRLNQWIRWKPSTEHVVILILLIVFAGTLFIRYMGWIQFLEFHHYDFFIRHQAKVDSPGPIVLVEMTESDIQSPDLDYPLHDSVMAEMLRQIEADQPAAIGLDIWRDLPVPKSKEGLDEFNNVLKEFSNIIAIFTLDGIAPPPVLEGRPDQIAFNDNFLTDKRVDPTIEKVRRSLLSVEDLDTGEYYYSLPYSLASYYLFYQQGIAEVADPDDPLAFKLGEATFSKFYRNDGAYVDADDRGFQMLLDFRCPESFTRYTVTEVLSGVVPVGAFRDKIVLVGINTPSVSDERVTPINRAQRGIELQAMTLNQLLRRAQNGEKELGLFSDWQEDIYILVWCIVGGMVSLGIRSTWRFASIMVACLSALPLLGWAAFVAGWWIPIVAPGMAFAGASVLVVSFASYRERLMRNTLMKLYSRQVSKEIAESIWEDRDSFLDGQRPLAQKLVATVLFTDLKGFSAIAETMEAARLYEWLDDYLGAMAKVIQDHGGVLKQFSGDGILALFGIPVPHTRREQQAADATAAARCAVSMGRRLVIMNRRWRKAGLPIVSMRAGLCSGEVAAGSVGSDDRFDYTVLGDVVNTASRLESYDKTFADPDLLPNRCRILIAASTHELLDGLFPSREIGLIEIRGKATKVSVYQLVDEPDGEGNTTSMGIVPIRDHSSSSPDRKA